MNLGTDEARRLAAVLLDGSPDEADPPDELPARGRLASGQIGAYRITRLLGLGGMGEVYEAQQENPARTVAVKVVRPDLVTPEALRRFDHETRILGRLQHPGIASIFEAGRVETAGGPLPFFAMEFVEGRPLTTYAAELKLGIRERLGLFLRVCEAVEHAHQKGVIHRDLKPGNILVDAGGRPRVLDFGVARATEADIRATTLHTEAGRLIGTLPYMSPEQVEGDSDNLDTRSDVYSLGVVLYELLGGRLPHEVKGGGRARIAEAVRAIHDSEPAPLSSIDRVFRGDLETIVGKAMAKERERRYQGVGELAGDIRRYLADEPIVARRPSAWYQARRFARRNKVASASLVALIAVLALSTLVSALLAGSAVRALGVAERQTAEALRQARVADQALTLFEETIVSAAPKRLGRNAKVVDAVRLALKQLDSKPLSEPLAELSARRSIGYALQQLGQSAESEPQLRRAMELASELHGEGSLNTAMIRRECAHTLLDLGKHEEAERLLRQVEAARSAILGAQHKETVSARQEIGEALLEQGRFAEAEVILRRALADAELLPDGDYDAGAIRHNLAAALVKQDRFSEALPVIEAVVNHEVTTHGEHHPETLLSRHLLVGVLIQSGRAAEAERLQRGILESAAAVFGEEHLSTMRMRQTLAGALFEQRRFEEAQTILLPLVQLVTDRYGRTHQLSLDTTHLLAQCLLDQNDPEEAARILRELYDALAEAEPSAAARRPAVGATLARAELARGRHEQAEDLARSTWEALQSAGIERGRAFAETAGVLATLYERAGDTERSAEYRAKSERGRARPVAPTPPP
ncbi:MAG: serine/threonine-protein kinase [Phycisphaerales bacterium]